MAYTKYSLTPANNTATPPDGAPEGMLPSAVNDTMRDMMAQIRDCGDGIRDGTYTMTAAKITGGTITGTTVTSNTFSSSGATITGGTINGTAIGGTTAAAGKFTTLEATGVTTVQAGTVSAPAITTSGDTNTGIFFPAADTIAFTEGGAEAMRIDSSGNVGIGTTSVTSGWRFEVKGGLPAIFNADSTANTATYGGVAFYRPTNTASNGNGFQFALNNSSSAQVEYAYIGGLIETNTAGSQNGAIIFAPTSANSRTERMRITSGGILLVGKTASALGTAGAELKNTGIGTFTVSADECITCNRLTSDGRLIAFYQDTVEEGTITVSGTTVSYNGGHLSRWAQMLTKPELLKGTVMSNLDEMNEYVDAEGNPVANEQLNKVKVSDVEGDVNVAGVFVNWSHDEQHNVDEINMAMTGDMIIRIAQGVVVQKGDLLMSAGDGTAKPQGDDIVRSKTIAKVTSNHITCTYADGSYCVPCVLMAC